MEDGIVASYARRPQGPQGGMEKEVRQRMQEAPLFTLRWSGM
jgi:hypothetical protein